jgi:hypothetical protein
MGMGGMGGMGGMMMPNQNVVERLAVVEAEGGQKLTGKVQLPPITVTAELGQYEIRPQHVKEIRFSKKPGAGKPQNEENEASQAPNGTVITTTDKEITGSVMTASWTLELEFGSITLDTSKIKSITFTSPPQAVKEPAARAGSAPTGRLRVNSIEGPNIAALIVEGPNITRVAASNSMSGDWVPIDLRVPISGRAVPIVGPGVVAYAMGSHVYAFSGEQRRWDVLDLPEGAKVMPIVGPGYVRVQQGNQTHEFTSGNGKWKHVDLQAILEPGRRHEEEPKAERPKQ